MSNQYTQLNRDMSSRKALIRDLATQLILHGEIKTTEKKAKLISGVVEKLVTVAKDNTLAARRQVAETVRFLKNADGKYAVQILFDEIAPKYKDRQGGYTQIFKLAPRQGDGAPMALIRFTK
ncbi:MAG: 50S ribosomal protein L17 [Gammaproteobacteria bacterium]|nr:50S ribosomal protein L17 [Gammaproteobacteria bacterium]